MNYGDEEFWAASHERLPYDQYYDPILDGFGEPELMFEAIERDLEAEDTVDDSSPSNRDTDDAGLENNAVGDDEYDFDVESGDWESIDPPDRNPASGYKPDWDKYYKEDFPEVDF